MEKLKISGNREDIFNYLSEFMSEEDALVFIQNIEKFDEYLDTDEEIDITTTYPKFNHSPGVLYSLVGKTNYNINLKASTISIIALILDITLTRGIISAGLAFTGFNTHCLVKLDEHQGEKCLVIESLRAKKDFVDSSILNKYEGKCANYSLECKYKNDCNCTIKNNEVEEILSELCSKNVFVKKGNKYKYNS